MLTVSVALRGLWATEKGAAEWTPLGQGAGSASIVNRGSSIVYDPNRPNTFWESGTYSGGGVYRTDDNGRTFRQLGDVRHSNGLSVDLTDPDRRTLLSGTHEQTAVFLSRDGGATWSDISRFLPNDVGFTEQPLILDRQTYLLGTSNGTNAGVFRTVDGGNNWKPVYRGAMGGRPLVAKSDGAIYWVTAAGGIIRSIDQGVTWANVAVGGFVYPSSPYLVELPDGSLAAASRSVVVSVDHGATWRAIGPTLPILPTGFAYSSFRNAFYIWYFSCDPAGANPIAANAILRLDFDYTTQ
jgi:photosystem II stability/assembly factor-like uncharacterized protein